MTYRQSSAVGRHLDRAKNPDVHGRRIYDGKFNHKDPMSQKDKWDYKAKLANEPEVELHQATLYSPHFKRKFNVVLCWHTEKKKHILLFSDDLNLEAQTLVQYYKSRFQIEFLFRDAKQYSGLTHAQVRDKEKLNFHFNFSFAVINQGRIIVKHNNKEQDYTFINAKRRGYNTLLLNEFMSNLELDPELPQIKAAFEKTAEFGLMRD